MKRFLALVLCLIALMLCACGTNTNTTDKIPTKPNKITDSFKVGNYTMTLPDGYAAEANSDHSYFITSEDGNSYMAIYALDVSLLDEAYVQEYIASQKGVFKDDDCTIYGEKTTQVNFAGTSKDMLIYVETDTSGYATLNIEGAFTDSWYGYTVFLQYPVDADKASDYASAFGEFCATAEYAGKAPRFDFVQ